ncbi:MAG: thioesterase family protein [Sneathiellales bacterium]|nr:thioesterase family protein [Sneathiellales bacterium]
MLETYRGVVRPDQEDHMGHMNVQYYTGKFDEATWHLFSAAGLTNSYFKSRMRGMAAVLQTTNYKAEAMAGDLLVIRTEMLEVKEKTIRFMHHMFNAEKETLVATTELVAAHLDRELRKSCPFPEEIRSNCEKLKP